MKRRSKFKSGDLVSFEQSHMGRLLPFIGEIHEIVQILGDLVLHVQVSHSDGTLWALVREESATLFEESGNVKVVERGNKARVAAKGSARR